MKRSILGIGLLCIFLLASTASAQTNRHDLTLPDLPVDSALPDGLLLAIESSTISPIAKLTASDGAVYDAFGISVAISGDTAIVGAQGDDDNGTDSGSAYIFIKNAGVWSQAAKLTASDGAVDDFFGYSVAISGDTAIVGAWLDDDNATDSGSAYVFVKPVSGWADMTQTAKLTASDGGFADYFGYSVAISSDTAIVGAWSGSGSAYIFVNNAGTWSQIAKLTASDGANGDELGGSVAISGDTAIVGAGSDDDNGYVSGSAYVFVKPVLGWANMTQTAKLTASDGAAEDHFGSSVAISGDTAIIGAWRDDDNGTDSGSAYVFVKPVSGWANMTQTAKLTASDSAASDHFGFSVAISADTAIVGAWWDDDNGSNSGSAYTFIKPVSGWANMTQTAKLTASDGAEFDYFGRSVAISGDTALVGAFWDDDNGTDSGSAYVFEVLPPVAPSDLIATPFSQTQIDLAWTDNSDDEDGFILEWSPNGTSSWTQLADQTDTTYTHTSLTCDTTYYYRVYAYNAGGYYGYATGSVTTDDCLQEMFYSQSAYDGWVRESGENTSKGGSLNNNWLTCLVGDDVYNRAYRTILHFNTSRIPDSAVITQVILQYKQLDFIGSDPYATHGPMVADIKEGFFSNNPALVLSDFVAAPSKSFAGSFVYTPSALAYPIYRANINSNYFQYLNKTGITQFRLHFRQDDDNDNVADVLRIFCGDMLVPYNRPVLRVRYYVP